MFTDKGDTDWDGGAEVSIAGRERHAQKRDE
jgi:hypothetical protein